MGFERGEKGHAVGKGSQSVCLLVAFLIRLRKKVAVGKGRAQEEGRVYVRETQISRSKSI